MSSALSQWFHEQEEEERAPKFTREDFMRIAKDLWLLEQYKYPVGRQADEKG